MSFVGRLLVRRHGSSPLGSSLLGAAQSSFNAFLSTIEQDFAALCESFAAFPVLERFVKAHLAEFEDLHGLNELVACLLVGEGFGGREGIVIRGALAEGVLCHRVFLI